MKSLPLALFSTILTITALVSGNTDKSAHTYPSGIPINVGLVSSWENTPLSLEALEFLRKTEGDIVFQHFIETYHLDESSTAQEQYTSLISQLSKVIPTPMVSVLEFGLASRTYSPAVAIHAQFRPSCAIPPNTFTYAVVDRRLIVANPEQLTSEIINNVNMNDATVVSEIVSEVDHIIKSGGVNAHEIYVYGVPGTESFVKFHKTVLNLIEDGNDITYVVRYFWDKNGNGITGALAGEENTPLQGYGVEFSLKSVEYKTIDERRTPNSDTSKDSSKNNDDKNVNKNADGENGIEKSDDFDKIDPSKINSFGARAGNHIFNAKNPLAAMRELTGDFPAYAVNLDRDGNKETEKSRKNLRVNYEHAGTESKLLVNGRVIDKPDDNVFSITSVITEEMLNALKLHKLGINDYESILSLLSKQLPTSDSVLTRYNISNPRYIAYLNDLEKDPEYMQFPNSVNDFLQPVWPGNLHFVAKNLFNIIVVVDPSDVYSAVLVSVLSRFVKQNLPMRVGVLLYAPHKASGNTCNENGECSAQDEIDVSRLIAKMFYHVRETKGSYAAASLFTMLIDAMETEYGDIDVDNSIGINVVKRAFKNARRVKLFDKMSWDAIVALDDVNLAEKIDGTNKYIESLQITKTPLVFVNGALVEEVKQPSHIIGYSNYKFGKELTERIRMNDITDDGGDTYEQILDTPYTAQRFSRYAIPTGDDKKKYVSLSEVPTTTAKYFHSVNRKELKKLSVIACVDLNSDNEEGRNFLTTLINSLHGESRLAIFPNNEDSTNIPVLWKALYALAYASNSETVLNEVLSVIEAMPVATIDDAIAAMEDIETGSRVKKFIDEHDDAFFIKAFEEQSNICKLAPNKNNKKDNMPSIIINGRVVEINETLPFEGTDFDSLQNAEFPVASTFFDDISNLKLKKTDTTTELRNDILMKVISQITYENSKRALERISLDKKMVPSFTSGKKPSESLAQIDFVIDPLTRSAQRISPILERLAEALPVRIRVYLAPQQAYENLPLKTFYRYVLDTKVTFDQATGALLPGSAHKVVARGLPSTRLITLGMEVPHKWIVMASEAVHDLDNIRLGDAEKNGDTSIDATFRLEHILVEGNCYDEATAEPPRGLELELTPKIAPTEFVSDTLVMSNFGYFQLKAVPGVWNLHVRSGGRSELLYSIKESQQDKNDNTGITVVVNSMDGATVRVVAKKNEGYEQESLLDIDDDDDDDDIKNNNNNNGDNSNDNGNPLGTFWDDILYNKKAKRAKESKIVTLDNSTDDDTINVFAIASGHLYERFVKIMMLSVLRGTKSPVKFWFIKNYLSPQFKEVIGDLSKHYGFDYELITYKWPHWLHIQTEKQRLIWGYKILFLDVIFPIGLKKVIYVDADQVVRSDLHELMEIPMDGAPIAMTPFCRGDSKREETAGYRFWDQGYWKNHLGDKPYHISALFVVDLQRFRSIGAGDTYRAYYDNLAHDPNSLANLDQDLPNYLQDKVPMKSLPQEWLWCQTWCNDESKPRAKTIDLCNNPMTKIPKLDSARINIPEWDDLDGDIHKTEVEILKSKTRN